MSIAEIATAWLSGVCGLLLVAVVAGLVCMIVADFIVEGIKHD